MSYSAISDGVLFYCRVDIVTTFYILCVCVCTHTINACERHGMTIGRFAFLWLFYFRQGGISMD